MRAAPIFVLSSADGTVSGDHGRTVLARRAPRVLGGHPHVCCHLQGYVGTGTAGTIDSLGPGSGVCVPPECAAAADSVGLESKICWLLGLFLPAVELDGPKGQLGVQTPSCWVLKSVLL